MIYVSHRTLANPDGFIVHNDGRVERPGRFGPSDTWRITGAVRLNNFGYVVQRYTLPEVLAGQNGPVLWRFKNGRQRTFLTDLDHGTPRVQMSPDADIRVISPEDVERIRYNARIRDRSA